MTGPKSSTRVGKEAVTERAWFALSQEDRVWKDIRGKETPACTKSQFRREYLIWEMTKSLAYLKEGRKWNRELVGYHTMRNALYPTESGPRGHKGDFSFLKEPDSLLGEMAGHFKSGA